MEGEHLKFYQTKPWKQAYELLMQVYKIIENYPNFEKFSLVDQTLRSANSVVANIAEAHGRYFFKDRIRVLYIARGEICETQSHLWVGNGREYLTKEIWLKIENDYENLKIGLNNQIGYYSRQKQQE